MQAYMIEKNRKNTTENQKEKPDIAIASFRKILKEKQETDWRAR